MGCCRKSNNRNVTNHTIRRSTSVPVTVAARIAARTPTPKSTHESIGATRPNGICNAINEIGFRVSTNGSVLTYRADNGVNFELLSALRSQGCNPGWASELAQILNLLGHRRSQVLTALREQGDGMFTIPQLLAALRATR